MILLSWWRYEIRRSGDPKLIETERLRLRRLTADDVDNLVELDSDPEVMRYINGGRATPREEIENVTLPRMLSFYERFDEYGYWAAEEKSTGEFVGWFGLHPQDDRPPDDISLGYRLRRSAWGKGYATEGSRALIDKAFRELGAQRVFAETMTVNAASRRVMEKAGLKYVRTFHLEWPEEIEGTAEGDVEYALTRAEWEITLGAEGSRDRFLELGKRKGPAESHGTVELGKLSLAGLRDAEHPYPRLNQAEPFPEIGGFLAKLDIAHEDVDADPLGEVECLERIQGDEDAVTTLAQRLVDQLLGSRASLDHDNGGAGCGHETHVAEGEGGCARHR